jgi:hypothetical protein
MKNMQPCGSVVSVIPYRLLLTAVLLTGVVPVSASSAEPALPDADALPEIHELPDLFRQPDGTRIRFPETWLLEQRAYLQKLLQHYVYGVVPSGTTKWVDVSENEDSGPEKTGIRRFVVLISNQKSRDKNDRSVGAPLQFRLHLTLPQEGRVRIPLFLVLTEAPVGERAKPGQGGRPDAAAEMKILERGYGLAEFNVADIAPDDPNLKEGLFLRQTAPSCGVLAAWAWACSRCMDCLINIDGHAVRGSPDATRYGVDYNRVSVVGRSHLGKAALLAAATDDRIALAAPVAAGSHGAASMRVAFDKEARATTRLEDTIPWHHLCPRYRTFHGRETRLPVDQHMLLALLAPRPLLVIADGTEQPYWLGYQQSFLAAREVYAFMGVAHRIGLHRLPGTTTDMTADAWQALLDFADWHLRSQPRPQGLNLEDQPFPKTPRNFSWTAPPRPAEDLAAEAEGLPRPWALPLIPDPDPLTFWDGRPVKTQEDWQARRKEIVSLMQHYLSGNVPPERLKEGTPPPQVREELALDGAATKRTATIYLGPDQDDPKLQMHLRVWIPKHHRPPWPAVLKVGSFFNPEDAPLIVKRGYIAADFGHGEGAGAYAHYPAPGDFSRTKIYCGPSMAWRMRRVLDVLLSMPEVDGKRLAAVGISGEGQLCQDSAAVDERIAVAVLSQCIHTFRRTEPGLGTGDKEKKYCPALRVIWNSQSLPADTYLQVAAIAPRPVLISLSRNYWFWQDSWHAYRLVAPIYRFFGRQVELGEDPGIGTAVVGKGPMRVHVRDGKHTISPDDWLVYLDFIDEFLQPSQKPEAK